MKIVPGLRSPYDKVGRLVYFGRMLDKIRLHAAGRLPPEFVANLGETTPRFFDARCCRFLSIRHSDLTARTLQGGTDEEILAWAHAHGAPRTDEDCAIWNAFMAKLGWRDDAAERVRIRAAECGLADAKVDTMFDLIELDEGRTPGRPCG
jgi:gluconokinase